jgi:hypothetical protein
MYSHGKKLDFGGVLYVYSVMFVVSAVKQCLSTEGLRTHWGPQVVLKGSSKFGTYYSYFCAVFI